MRVNLQTQNLKTKPIPINSKPTVEMHINKRKNRKKQWQKRFNERSNNYVPRKPFIHYADRFSRAKE